MLELLGDARIRSGIRSRLVPEDNAAEHWIAWDDNAAICMQRQHPETKPCDATALRLTALRVLKAGLGTRLRLADGRQWRWEGRPATHLLPSGTRVRADFTGDCAMVLLTLSSPLLRRVLAGTAGGALPPCAELDAPNPIIASLIDSVAERCRRESSFALSWVRSIAPVIAIEMLVPDAGASTAGDVPPLQLQAWRLKRLDEMIEASLDAWIPLARMADAVGLSLFHFARTFRSTLGLTPQAYVQLRRCEKARSLMEEDRLTLSEIALACGFTSQSHFTTVFKRLEGITPGRWRGRNIQDPRSADAD